MASLTAQMEELQKQQAILAEKIKEDEERNLKLNKEASIERLEALIEPITQQLDWIKPGCNGRIRYAENNCNYYSDLSTRENINNKFNEKKRRGVKNTQEIKYNCNHMLANEEIFVTLLGIIKKQDARIGELELLSKK